MKKSLFHLVLLIFIPVVSHSQGLDSIIVEIVENSVGTDTHTYRVFVDMEEGYGFSAVFGDANHTLRIETSTSWWNASAGASKFAENIDTAFFPFFPSLKYDSWVSAGAGAKDKIGVPLSKSPTGFIDPDSTVTPTTTIGLDLTMFDTDLQSSDLIANNGSWAGLVLGGVKGPDTDNQVLIGQFTTDGEFSFELNITLIDPEGDGWKYVAKNPLAGEIQFPGLTYPVASIPGCMSPTACNYDSTATIDDGSCIEPVEDCWECNATNDGLIIIDSDGDGICDAEEIPGCMSPTACNYDPDATDDDGSCIEPVEDCWECNAANDGLIIIDSDGDGTCDANDSTGCTSPTACNYNEYATVDDGSCLEPVPECWECSGDTLRMIDSDGDGICDLNDITGCTNPTACNYNPDATEDDGSCLLPVEYCSYCEDDTLMIYDIDGDGICDLNDDIGCTSPTACNYNEFATFDDGSCLEPVENCTECEGYVLTVIDTDLDGICDADEIPGCMDTTACNYNPDATDDDGSCLIPVRYCSQCSGDTLVIIDTDGDGICDADEPGLEDLIVEIYYISDSSDATDTDGGNLPPGSVTYRLYTDMAVEYELSAVYGDKNHELFFETSTEFFNNTSRGEELGESIRGNRLDENTVAIDSWLTIAAATNEHIGVLKAVDPDGSLVGGSNSDGGSNKIEGGILKNDLTDAGIPLTVSDGLKTGTGPEITTLPGLDLTPFGNQNYTGRFSITNNVWSSLEGYTSPDYENQVLIAQITTDGEFVFELNVQVISPDGKGERYVARDPLPGEIRHESLSYRSRPGCTDSTACNYDPEATLENGTCLKPVANCYECSGDTLRIIDSDGDGICDASDPSSVYGLEAINGRMRVYPNPVQDHLTLEILNEGKYRSYVFRITDMKGDIVLLDEIGRFAGKFTRIIDVSSFQNGIYSIQVISEDGYMSSEIIEIL